MGLFNAFPYRILFYILIPYFIFLILIQLKPVSIKENFDPNPKGLTPLQRNIKRDDAEEKRIEKQLKKVDAVRKKNYMHEYQIADRTELEFQKLHKEINELKDKLAKCGSSDTTTDSLDSKIDSTLENIEKDSDTETTELTDLNKMGSGIDSLLKQNQSEPKKEKKESKPKEKIVVGCEKDADCNLFYGDGKNTCKSNKQCRCEEGAGVLCQMGPTNFKDPKDMTKKEKTIFKNTSNYDNFTIQDYKNWLQLYNKDYYLLSDEHLINLRKVMRGEPLALRDIPTGGLRPPLTSQKYFAEMYDKLGEMEQIVSPINSSTTGAQVGYNYNQYSDFSPPNALPQLRVISGEIERKYRRPSAINKIFPVPLEDAIGPYQSNPAM